MSQLPLLVVLSEKLLTSGPRQVTRGWRKDNKDSNRATDSTIGLLVERDHAPPISKDLYVCTCGSIKGVQCVGQS
jgi:hypothetical protein